MKETKLSLNLVEGRKPTEVTISNENKEGKILNTGFKFEANLQDVEISVFTVDASAPNASQNTVATLLLTPKGWNADLEGNHIEFKNGLAGETTRFDIFGPIRIKNYDPAIAKATRERGRSNVSINNLPPIVEKLVAECIKFHDENFDNSKVATNTSNINDIKSKLLKK